MVPTTGRGSWRRLPSLIRRGGSCDQHHPSSSEEGSLGVPTTGRGSWRRLPSLIRRGGSCDQHHPGASRHPSSSEEGSLGGTDHWSRELETTPLLDKEVVVLAISTTPAVRATPPHLRRGALVVPTTGRGELETTPPLIRRGGSCDQHHPGTSRHPSSSEEGALGVR